MERLLSRYENDPLSAPIGYANIYNNPPFFMLKCNLKDGLLFCKIYQNHPH